MTPEWRTRALCSDPAADPNLFIDTLHGEEPSDRDTRHQEAAGWCDRCPVAEACLAHGRRWREGGIWGGWTDLDRPVPRRILTAAEKRHAEREAHNAYQRGLRAKRRAS